MNILFIVIAIISMPFIVALFVKKAYSITGSVIILTTQKTVFNYLKIVKNQEYYSKWVMRDPTMKKTFTGTDGMVGFIYAWDSSDKNVGKGEQEIKRIDHNQIDLEIRFEKPFKGIAQTSISTELLSENKTKVVWNMSGKSNYPMNIMNLFMGGILRKDIEKSLNQLKINLE